MMYNIDLLAKLSGLTRRTIRYYIQIGLLEPPNGNCRGSYYTDNHLNRLEQIKSWARQGVPLSQVKEIICGKTQSVMVDCINIICTSQWERLEITDGLELHFRSNFLKGHELKKINDFIHDLLEYRNDSEEY